MSDAKGGEIFHTTEILRSYSQPDLDRLVETWVAGFPGTQPKDIVEHVPHIVHAQKSELMVARNPLGHIASAMVVNVDMGRDKKRGHIDDVATHPDDLRQGYGGAVLDFSIGWFRDKRVKRVYLTSNDNRQAAHSLYISRGFKIHDTNEFQLDL